MRHLLLLPLAILVQLLLGAHSLQQQGQWTPPRRHARQHRNLVVPATSSDEEEASSRDDGSLGAFGFTPGGKQNSNAFSERTVLLEEARNPWRGPRSLVYIMCMGGGGASAYFASTGLLARSMGINAASVAGQSTAEVGMSLAIDLAAFTFGITGYLRERKERSEALSRISLNEAAELAKIQSEDQARAARAKGLFEQGE